MLTLIQDIGFSYWNVSWDDIDGVINEWILNMTLYIGGLFSWKEQQPAANVMIDFLRSIA